VSQRILVLGASGYIGQHLVQALSEQGYRCWRRHAMSTGCKSSISRA
jgi:nucleoside-diphosphate-sugar epimerase